MYTGVCASQYNVGHLYTRSQTCYIHCVHVWDCYRLTQDSIMSLDMSLSRVSRCLPNSSSGQWRSRMNVCRASNFQKRSSDVPEPLLQSNHRSVSETIVQPSITPSPAWMTLIPAVYWRSSTSNRRTDKDGRYLQIVDHRSGVLYSQWTVWSSSRPGGWKVQLFSFLDVYTSLGS